MAIGAETLTILWFVLLWIAIAVFWVCAWVAWEVRSERLAVWLVVIGSFAAAAIVPLVAALWR